MKRTRRPLLCAAMTITVARSSSAFPHIIWPTLSASSAPRIMLTWYGTCMHVLLGVSHVKTKYLQHWLRDPKSAGMLHLTDPLPSRSMAFMHPPQLNHAE